MCVCVYIYIYILFTYINICLLISLCYVKCRGYSEVVLKRLTAKQIVY
jgi:hypothetical protein